MTNPCQIAPTAKLIGDRIRDIYLATLGLKNPRRLFTSESKKADQPS